MFRRLRLLKRQLRFLHRNFNLKGELFALFWILPAWLRILGRRRTRDARPNGSGKPQVLFVMERWCDCDPERGTTNSLHNLCGSLAATGMAEQRRFFYDWFSLRTGHRSDLGLLREIRKKRPSVIVVTVAIGRKKHPAYATLMFIRWVLRIPVVFVWFDFVQKPIEKLARTYARVAALSIVLDVPVALSSGPLMRRRFLPLWCPQDPRYFCVSDPSRVRDIDVCFLGSRANHPDRRRLLTRLRQLPIRLYEGGGQREQRLSLAEYVDLLQRSKIVVNFSRAIGGSAEHQVKGRVFEVIHCGAMLLETRNRETPHWLEPQTDYVEFDGEDDLVAKVERCLQNEAERNEIALSGFEKSRTMYSASHFWEAVFQRTLGDRFRHAVREPQPLRCTN